MKVELMVSATLLVHLVVHSKFSEN